MARLSLCMITRDEAQNLPDCLRSVKDIVDEIVISDTGSTDNTIEIAKEFGARVEQIEWPENFAAARNTALEICTGEWILQLDADERLADGSPDKIRAAIEVSDYQAYEVTVRNYHPPEDSTPFLDSPQIRLFRNNPDYRYEGSIHEQIGPAISRNNGRIKKLELQIDHLGYRNGNLQKAKRNLAMIEAVLRREPDNSYILFKKGETLKALGKFEQSRRAFTNALDGKKTKLPAEILEILYMRVAQLDLQKNAYQSARNWAGKCLQLNPVNGIALYVRTVAALYLRLVEPALADLKTLMQLGEKAPVEEEQIHKLLAVCQQLK